MKSKIVISAQELYPFKVKEDRLVLKPERFSEAITTLQRITQKLLANEDDFRTLAQADDEQIAAAVSQIRGSVAHLAENPSRASDATKEGDN